MRIMLWSMLGLLAVTAGSRAEVVLTPGSFNSGITQNDADISSGFTFTTTGSTASSGRWRLTNLQFGLSTTSPGKQITGFDVFLYKANGANWDYVTGGTQANTTTTSVSNGVNNVFSLAFNQNAAFGQAGVENSGLEAGATYFLGINVSGADAPNLYFSGSSAAASGTWGAAGSKWNNNAFTAANITGNDISSWQAGENIYVQLDATAVPEPGTLLLGGIAAVSGGAGVWWRRKKKQPVPANADSSV